MKIRNARLSPALAIAMIALFVTLGGSAFAVTSGDRASTRGKLSLRFGKLVDRDTTAFDGSRNIALVTPPARKASV